MTLAAGQVSAQLAAAAPGRPVLVLCHSLLADRSSFAPVIEGLAAHFSVIALDLPGFGGSAAVPGGLAAIADRVASAVVDADARYPAAQAPTVLGNGYGGFVTLLMAIRHPGLASRLVLADTGAAFSEPGREAFRGMARAASAKGLEAVADTAMRRLFATDFHAANPALVADRRARFLAMDPGVFLAACAELAALDLRPDLPSVKLPALVLVGAQDEATPPPMSEELAAGLPHASLTVLSGCAHVPQLQAPDRLLAAVLPFLIA